MQMEFVMMKEMLDKYKGSMLGLAIGDALGATTEFMTYDEIRIQFPPDGVLEFHAFRGLRAGSYTDDTEMTIAVALGILHAKGADTESVLDSIADEFVKWGDQTRAGRSPGRTCTSSVARLKQGLHWSQSGNNDSKGCGTAMRSAPIGLAYKNKMDMLMEIAAKSSLATHGHPAATAGSIGTAYLVVRALEGVPILDAVDSLMEETKGMSKDFTDCMGLIPAALEEEDSRKAHEMLGEGWVAEEALAGAVYVCVKHPDSYEKAVLEAANANGDTDSKACIAGAIAGAYHGESRLPSRWKDQVEDSSLLSELAEKLYDFSII